jgi:hypothetical protein
VRFRSVFPNYSHAAKKLPVRPSQNIYILLYPQVLTFSSENFFRRSTYILFPGSELVSCDTLKSFAAQRKSFAARHGKLKSNKHGR